MVDVVDVVGLMVLVDVVGGGNVATTVVKLQPELDGVNDVGFVEGGEVVVVALGTDVVVEDVVTDGAVVVVPDEIEVVVTGSVEEVVVVELGGIGDAADKSMARNRKPPTTTAITRTLSATRSGHRRGVERLLSLRVIPTAPYVSTWA